MLRIPVTLARVARVAAHTHVRTFAAAAGGDYDVAVIGGGPGGYVAAIKAGQLGLKYYAFAATAVVAYAHKKAISTLPPTVVQTVCVESRGTLGGTCLNVGCIPSKALLHSSHMYEHARKDFGHHGINVSGISVDLDKMMEAKAKGVKGLTSGIEGLFKKNKVDYVKGHGRIAAPGRVVATLNEGGEKEITAKNIIIATGSEPTPLPPVPVDNAKGRIVDSTGALALQSIPKSMAVIGGGVIGLELGSVWRRLGAKVTVVEFLDRIVPSGDTETGTAFQRILTKQGMAFKLGTKVTSSSVTDSGVTLSLEPAKGGEKEEMTVDVVLVATGRRPYTQGLGLAEVGVKQDRIGRVIVDKEFRTNVPGIWAIGDVIEGPMLAHKAEEEGIAAVENIKGLHGHVNYDAIPGVIYTYPEVANVGKTEEQLKEAGIKYKKGTFPFQANSRARAMQDAEGLVKILSDATTDRILGIHIIGPNAGEMIAEGVLGIEYGASSEDIARTCHAHPTLSEAFKEAAMAVYSKPIHF